MCIAALNHTFTHIFPDYKNDIHKRKDLRLCDDSNQDHVYDNQTLIPVLDEYDIPHFSESNVVILEVTNEFHTDAYPATF